MANHDSDVNLGQTESVKIGQSVLPINPTNISVSIKEHRRNIRGLRGIGGTSIPTGQNIINIDLRFYLVGTDQINIFRDIIAQFKAAFFLPIKNEFLFRMVNSYSYIVGEFQVKDLDSTYLHSAQSIISEAKTLVSLATSNKNNSKTLSFFAMDKALKAAAKSKISGFDTELFNAYQPLVFIDRFQSILEGEIIRNPDPISNPISVKDIIKKAVRLIQSAEPENYKKFERIYKYIIGSLSDDESTALPFMVLKHQELRQAELSLEENEKTIAELKNKSDNPTKVAIGATHQNPDRVFQMAYTNIEWKTHPDLTNTIVARVSGVFFNHDPYIGRIKYHAKGQNGFSYNISDCSIFTDYWVSRYKSHSFLSENQKSAAEIRNDINKRRSFAWNPDLKTTLYYDVIEDWRPNNRTYNHKGEVASPAEQVKADKAKTKLKRDGAEFSEGTYRRIDRNLSNARLITMDPRGALRTDSFLDNITCSIEQDISIVPLQGNNHPTIQFMNSGIGRISLRMRAGYEGEDSDGSIFLSELRRMQVFIQQRYLNGTHNSKFLKVNPIVVINAVSAIGGMFNFSIEELNIINEEDSTGELVCYLNMIEQLLPPTDSDLLKPVILETVTEALAHRKLRNIIDAMTLSDKLASKDSQLSDIALDLREQFFNNILTPKVVKDFWVKNCFVTTMKFSKNNGETVFNSEYEGVAAADIIEFYKGEGNNVFNPYANFVDVDGQKAHYKNLSNEVENSAPQIHDEIFSMSDKIMANLVNAMRMYDIVATTDLVLQNRLRRITGRSGDAAGKLASNTVNVGIRTFGGEDQVNPDSFTDRPELLFKSWSENISDQATEIGRLKKTPMSIDNLYTIGDTTSLLTSLASSLTFGTFDNMTLSVSYPEEDFIVNSSFSSAGLSGEYYPSEMISTQWPEDYNHKEDVIHDLNVAGYIIGQIARSIEPKETNDIVRQLAILSNVTDIGVGAFGAELAFSPSSRVDFIEKIGKFVLLAKTTVGEGITGLINMIPKARSLREQILIIRGIAYIVKGGGNIAFGITFFLGGKAVRLSSFLATINTVLIGKGASFISRSTFMRIAGVSQFFSGARKVVKPVGRFAVIPGLALSAFDAEARLQSRMSVLDYIDTVMYIYMKTMLTFAFSRGAKPNKEFINRLADSIGNEVSVGLDPSRSLSDIYSIYSRNRIVPHIEDTDTTSISAYPEMMLPKYSELKIGFSDIQMNAIRIEAKSIIVDINKAFDDKDLVFGVMIAAAKKKNPEDTSLKDLSNLSVESADTINKLVDDLGAEIQKSRTRQPGDTDESAATRKTLGADVDSIRKVLTKHHDAIDKIVRKAGRILASAISDPSVPFQTVAVGSKTINNIIGKLKALENRFLLSGSEEIASLIPTFEELGIEPNYIAGVGRDPSRPARGLNDFVDPTFYILENRLEKSVIKSVVDSRKLFKTMGDSVSIPENVLRDFTANRRTPRSIFIDEGGKGAEDGLTQDQIIKKRRAAAASSEDIRNIIEQSETPDAGPSIDISMADRITLATTLQYLENGEPQGTPNTEQGSTDNSVLSDQASNQIMKFIDTDRIRDLAQNTVLYGTSYEHDSMRRAFPTFSIFFIEENDINHLSEKNNKEAHLFDDLYYYQPLIDLQITRHKFDTAIATARLLNIYGHLDNYVFSNKLKDPTASDFVEGVDRSSNLTELFYLQNIKLQEGTVVQIRHGYASNFRELDIVFTGKISHVTEGDEIEIIMQGHEHELNKEQDIDLSVGITTGQNFFTYATEIMRNTEHFGDKIPYHELAERNRSRALHNEGIFSGGSRNSFLRGAQSLANPLENFSWTNIMPNRVSDNLWIKSEAIPFLDWFMCGKFRITGQTLLESIHEISRFHHGMIAMPVPYDTRATMYMGPANHPYRYTSKRMDEFDAWETDLRSIQPILSRGIGPSDEITVAAKNIFFAAKQNYEIYNDLFGIGASRVNHLSNISNAFSAINNNDHALIRRVEDAIARKLNDASPSTRSVGRELIYPNEFDGPNEFLVAGLGLADPETGAPNLNSGDAAHRILGMDLSEMIEKIPLELRASLLSQYLMLSILKHGGQTKAGGIAMVALLSGAEASAITAAVGIIAVKVSALAGFVATTAAVGVSTSITPIGWVLLAAAAIGTVAIVADSIFTDRDTEASKFIAEANALKTETGLGLTVKPTTEVYSMVVEMSSSAGTNWNSLNNKLKSVQAKAISLINGKNMSLAGGEKVESFISQSVTRDGLLTAGQLAGAKIFLAYAGWYRSNLARNGDEEQTSLDIAISSRSAAIEHAFESSAKTSLPPGYKNFLSYHLIDDRDIIANNIECTVREMANEVWVTCPEYHLNATRWLGKQIAGGFNLESAGSWETRKVRFDSSQPLSERIIRQISERNAFTPRQQMNIAFRDLAEAMKPMYRGDIKIIGKRDIKPNDIIYIKDSYNQMYGAIEVERVTHLMDFQSGWVTCIEPHLITNYAETENWITQTAIISAISLASSAFDLAMLFTAGKFLKGALTPLLPAAGEAVSKKFLSQARSEMMGFITQQGPGASRQFLYAVIASSLLDTGADIGFEVYNRINPTAIIRGANKVRPGQPDYLNPVSINPLKYAGRPWVAGLKGVKRSNFFEHIGEKISDIKEGTSDLIDSAILSAREISYILEDLRQSIIQTRRG